jgi:putative hemolysin
LGDISEEHIGLIQDLEESVKQAEEKGVRLGHQLRSERNEKHTAEGRLNAVSAVLNPDMTSSEKKDVLQQAGLTLTACPIGANTPNADQQSINGSATGDAYCIDAGGHLLLAGKRMDCISCADKKAKHLPVYEDGTDAPPNILYCGRCVHARMNPWGLQQYKDPLKPTDEELLVYKGYHSSCLFESERAHFKFGGSAFKKCEELRRAEEAGRTEEAAEIIEVLRGENNTHGGVYGKRMCDFTRKPISHFIKVTNGLDPDTVNNFGNNGGFQRM